jgi:serine protease Do
MKQYVHVAALAAALCVAVCAAPAEAGSQSESRVNATVKAVRKVKPSVVAIKAPGATSKNRIVGTGVIIDERGYVITNRHVIAGVDPIVVCLADDTELAAKIVVADSGTDLAVLKIDAGRKLPALELARADDIEVGEDVIAVGHPLGYSYTVSKGIVSALGRKIELPNGAILTGLIQTTAPINPGNSGGPLISIDGQFIGVNTALRDGAQNIAFAINTDAVKRVLRDKLSAIKVAGVSHGLEVHDKAALGAGDQRLVVAGSTPASSAAGLKHGDEIRCVANLTVKNSFDLERALWDAKPGQKVTVHVRRGEQEVTVTLTLLSVNSGR